MYISPAGHQLPLCPHLQRIYDAGHRNPRGIKRACAWHMAHTALQPFVQRRLGPCSAKTQVDKQITAYMHTAYKQSYESSEELWAEFLTSSQYHLVCF